MPNTIKFSDNPNEETAFVTTEDDTRTRAVVTTAVEGTVKFPDNPNSTKVSVTVDGVARKAVAVYNLNGSGDSHNKGYFATQAALEEAYPTGEAGDYAIVGSTDTVWLWDSDTNAWVDSDTKGEVTSVGGQTGDVSLKTINNNNIVGVGNIELSTSLPYPAGWTTNSTTKAFCDDIAADTTATVAKMYLGEVTFSDLPASMVNGEVVVEIMDGTTAANKVIILTLKSGNVAPYAWQYVYWNGGSNVSGWKTWQEPLVSGTNIKTINGTSLLGSGDITTEAIQVDTMPTAAVGELGKVYQFIGATGTYTHGYFYECENVTSDLTATQTSGSGLTITDIDKDRFEAQTTTSGTYVFTYDGLDWQLNGNDVDITLGYGISYSGTATAGDEITAVYTAGGYKWTQTNVQPAPVIPDPLPTQTGNSGKFLTTDGTNASWSDKPLVNKATRTNALTILGNPATQNHCVNIGEGSSTTDASGVAVGNNASAGAYSVAIGGAPSFITSANASGNTSIAIGYGAKATASSAIQIGAGTNNNTQTLRVSLKNDNNNYELLSADGTVPTDRFTTTPSADGTYVPTLTISSGVATRSWAAPSGGGSASATTTLAVNDWSSNTQTVNVTGVTANNNVIVAPAPASQADYSAAGILCTAQGAGTLTFTCTSTPSSAITVNVLIFN